MNRKPVTLALQGGGSHGAFTWGVLDRLLEDEGIAFEAISGASAGAVNAVVMAHGMTAGGRDGARQALKEFWEGLAATAHFGAQPEDLTSAAGDSAAQSSASVGMESLFSMMRHFAPRQFNPLDVNPLRDLLEKQVDFERIRRDCKVGLFIATTHVGSGLLHLFRTPDVTLDILLASACVPGMHHAIDIGGEAYWDGGLTANPPLFPLVQECDARDLLMILLQPAPRRDTPTTAKEIRRRLSEISFSSAFHTELQGLAIARRAAGSPPIAFGRLQRGVRSVRTHMIDTPDLMGRLSAVSKVNVHPEFIHALRDEGRQKAGLWLERHLPQVGVRSTFELEDILRRKEGAGTPPARPSASFAAGTS